MSKLLNSVLNKISEDNNEYRIELRRINSSIDEKATALVGDIVTLSNYTIDFSNTMSSAKEMIVTPIIRTIESYVIRDLRCVESVNEQFVEKINDKIDSANIITKEDSDKFINNLNILLNEKYLQIVKIKRSNFINENGTNDEIEKIIADFIGYLEANNSFDNDRLVSLFIDFKNEIYNLINNALTNISNLYLNNFVNVVSEALDGTVNNEVKENNIKDFAPSIPDINPVPEIDVPLMANDDGIKMTNYDEVSLDIPSALDIPNVPDIPTVPATPDVLTQEDVKPMDVKPIAPIEIVEEPSKKEEPAKHSYDVEEILKIAKSPVVTMPSNSVQAGNPYVNVALIDKKEEVSVFDEGFNEREVVEEMIKRLTKRLEDIDARQAKLDDEIEKVEADENFVNDLIKNSTEKKEELDKFEESLDEKEKELDNKKDELDKKIKNVLPFANAVLNSEEESKE